MKQNEQNIKLLVATLVGAATMIYVTGCASTTPSSQQATVCPQCKTAVEQVSTYIGDTDLQTTREERRHSCPGCQGALVTLFKEGKLQHKCSICAQSPFTCSVTHPTKEGVTKPAQ